MFRFDFLNIKQIMKKIVSILVLLLAFSINAQAQTEKKEQEKIKPEVAAKMDVEDLMKVVPSNGTATYSSDLYQLFLKKHKDISKFSDENGKKQISNAVAGKLEASLTEEQISQIKSVPGLYERLIK